MSHQVKTFHLNESYIYAWNKAQFLFYTIPSRLHIIEDITHEFLSLMIDRLLFFPKGEKY